MLSSHNDIMGEAREIVGNPKPDHSPLIRRLAWAILKASHGQTIRQHRLQTEATKPAGQVV